MDTNPHPEATKIYSSTYLYYIRRVLISSVDGIIEIDAIFVRNPYRGGSLTQLLLNTDVTANQRSHQFQYYYAINYFS